MIANKPVNVSVCIFSLGLVTVVLIIVWKSDLDNALSEIDLEVIFLLDLLFKVFEEVGELLIEIPFGK